MSGSIQFPALEEAREQLQKIFSEAGPQLDFKAVKSVPEDMRGNTKAIATHVRELNDRVEELTAVQGAYERGGFAESGTEQGGTGQPGAGGTVAPPGGEGGFARAGASLKGREVLTKGQSVGQWLHDNGHVARGAPPLSFGRYLKGIVTGDWRGADAELKALSEGTLTAGGHLVPTPLAGQVIDLARNAMRVMQAGATTVPMTAQTLKVARLTGEGVPGWRNENAPITAADMTFDSVTLTARSLARLITLSVELFEDSDPAAQGVIERSFAAQIALELDRAALRGTGTAPEPRGVLNQTGVTLTTHGANGAAITNYDFHLDAAGAVRSANFEPTSHIQAVRTSTSLSKLKEATTNAYMAPPAALLPMLPTKQIPINLTVGTSNDCSELYTADWAHLLVGIRTSFNIQLLRERFIDNGQYAFLAWLRADIQLSQPAAFVVDTGVRG